jgi:GNAT superfamily N-acetyltransferase
MIEIRKYNKSTLGEYIVSEQFLKSTVIPISQHRAISQIKNPVCNDEDILLLTAHIAGELVGYLGVLPDDMYGNQGEKKHIGWMSCLWVDPNHRGKKIAQNLILNCFDAWNNNILLTEYTETAGKLYDKMGIFTTLHLSHGRRWYIKSDLSTILPPKKQIFIRLKPLLQLIDMGVNAVLTIMDVFAKKTILRNMKVEYTNAVDAGTEDFIQSQVDSQTFKRTKTSLDWIMQSPWVINANTKDELAKKYYFTSSEKLFQTVGIKISKADNTIIAFLVITNRNGHLRIPYLFCDKQIDVVRKVINQYVREHKIKTVSIYQPSIIQSLYGSTFIRSFSKSIQRGYLVSKSLAQHTKRRNPLIQDGDGDAAFT